MGPPCGKPLAQLSRLSPLCLAAALLLSAVPIQAADDYGNASESAYRTRFEITPFAGYRMGGDFDIMDSSESADLDNHVSYGLLADLRIDEASAYELLYSREETQLESGSPLGRLGMTVEYLHIGGTVEVDEDQQSRFRPYVAGGLGVTRLKPESASGASDDTRFSLSLGLGFYVPVNPHFSVRLEGRGFLTVMDSDSAFFCASGAQGGVCNIRASGSTFIQGEVLAGAAFTF